ncbi:two-component system chemotaxis response regulator CheB [Saccharothrix tamanrassetensis]|uniref:protein-glutamate methylesterase n=1 Tax=Saccharothrix tamanrassetensis TaxID=1051531 RepID=A0A841CP38_9PSEU|nr:chemotaxis protein CheB [Saccharothrix tamanrassetensis]MBB5960212.1 two-component system chemotaxis response regulator CheB [Saccharothrix tamanrassetensis]
MPTRDLIVVGASAGGVEALRAFVAGLPEDLEAAVAVVLHLPSGGTSALPAILDRSGPLPAVGARAGMPLRPGRIHVAPPDHHLLVVDGTAHLSHGPTENGHRPAVDALFRSAAAARGSGVIGVVLSGALDDGAAGMVAIANRGGLTVVQDPEEALYTGMPSAVMRHVSVDHVVSAGTMGALLKDEVGRRVPDGREPSEMLRREVVLTANDGGADPSEVRGMGTPSNFSCPDCSGTLVELDVEGSRFRCQIGHGWTADALLDAQDATLEKALWTALRTLEEKANLARRMRADAQKRGADAMVKRYQNSEQESTAAADVLRGHLMSGAFAPNPQAEHST